MSPAQSVGDTPVRLTRRELFGRDGWLRLAHAFLPSRVATRDRRSPARPVIGGIARVMLEDCLAHQGSFCSSCRERCPEPGAIAIDRGRPTVVPARCTGCGICHEVCPAPRNAIVIGPRP